MRSLFHKPLSEQGNECAKVSLTCLFPLIVMNSRLYVDTKTSEILTDVRKVIGRVVNTRIVHKSSAHAL